MSQSTQKVSHRKLVEEARLWLIGAKRCNPVFCEKGSQNLLEFPDAIGWTADECYVVECKSSVADFNKDKDKVCRLGGNGLGDKHYYLVPIEILDKIKLPEDWGLVVYYGHSEYVRQVKDGYRRKDGYERDYKSEVYYLRSRILEIQRYRQ